MFENIIVQQYGNTALILGSYNGHKEIVEMLLKMPNIDINIKIMQYMIEYIL